MQVEHKNSSEQWTPSSWKTAMIFVKFAGNNCNTLHQREIQQHDDFLQTEVLWMDLIAKKLNGIRLDHFDKND